MVAEQSLPCAHNILLAALPLLPQCPWVEVQEEEIKGQPYPQVSTPGPGLETLKSYIAKVGQCAADVEGDAINTETYVKGGFVSLRDCISAIGILFEAEHIRIAHGVQARSTTRIRTWRCHYEAITECKVVQNLKALTGDKSTFRQWHQKMISVTRTK